MVSPELLNRGGSRDPERPIDIAWNPPYAWCAGIALLAWKQVSKLCRSNRCNSLEMSGLPYWHPVCSSTPRWAIQFSLGNQT
jgi:hypothetical protein